MLGELWIEFRKDGRVPTRCERGSFAADSCRHELRARLQTIGRISFATDSKHMRCTRCEVHAASVVAARAPQCALIARALFHRPPVILSLPSSLRAFHPPRTDHTTHQRPQATLASNEFICPFSLEPNDNRSYAKDRRRRFVRMISKSLFRLYPGRKYFKFSTMGNSE